LDKGDNPVIVFCDNAGCTAKVKVQCIFSCEDIDVAYHLSENQVAVGYIEPGAVPTADNVVDMFTISTERVKLIKLRFELGLI
jgi:hypothetical protein